MRLSLIGMSGCGKTHWSKQLSDHGFRRFCCDDLITEKIVSTLKETERSSFELGKWMGFPYEPRYKKREEQYLSCEKEVLKKILDHLDTAGNDPKKNIIVDTTGSVIYTGHALLTRLQKTTTVVYLETSPEVQHVMLEKYVRNKRPVLWRNFYNRHPHETVDEAIARCYAALLTSRAERYPRYAHITIDYDQRAQQDFGLKAFLRICQKYATSQ